MSKKGITIYIKFTSLIFCLISNSYGFSGKNCKKKDMVGVVTKRRMYQTYYIIGEKICLDKTVSRIGSQY